MVLFFYFSKIFFNHFFQSQKPPRAFPPNPPPRGTQNEFPSNFKISSRGFAKSFPQKIVFAKPSPHCIRISVLSLWQKLFASHRGALAHGCAISHLFGKKFAQMIQLHQNFVLTPPGNLLRLSARRRSPRRKRGQSPFLGLPLGRIVDGYCIIKR